MQKKLKNTALKMISKEEIIQVLKDYKDPEIGLDIWTLGLIYKVEIDHDYVKITMTFTSPFCPYGPHMVEEIKNKLKEKGIKKVEIEITFDPVWEPSEELKEILSLS